MIHAQRVTLVDEQNATELPLADAIEAETLPTLTDRDLKEIGVPKLGHRKKLLASIAGLRGEIGESIPPKEGAVSPALKWLATLSIPVALPLAEGIKEVK